MAGDTASSMRQGAEEMLYYGEDYQKHFNPKGFLNRFYAKCDPTDDDHAFSADVMDCFHRLFDTGKFRGKKLLDICSGPSIYSVISASKYFSEIYLTDYAEPNREELHHWLSRDELAHDWSSYFTHVACLEGEGTTAGDVENRLRGSIKDVLACDLNLDEPLGKAQYSCTPADAIISCFTLKCIVQNQDSYPDFVKKLATMLAPEGLLCLLGVEDETFYYADEGEKFFSNPFPKLQVLASLHQAGFNDIEFQTIKAKKSVGFDGTRCFFVSAINRS